MVSVADPNCDPAKASRIIKKSQSVSGSRGPIKITIQIRITGNKQKERSLESRRFFIFLVLLRLLVLAELGVQVVQQGGPHLLNTVPVLLWPTSSIALRPLWARTLNRLLGHTVLST